MIHRKDLDNKRKKKIPINITSKGIPQYQYTGFILIMSGYKKVLVHVNPISVKYLIK